ncbi:MAG: DUF4167 domain-containing protein [Parvibaculales bacterium]
MKRSRGRNRRQGNPANRNYESNGPDVKVRGHASTINEKYLSLARDALTAGDPVNAENYFQHAEHYFRIMSANQPAKTDVAAGQDTSDAEGNDGNVEPLILGQGEDDGKEEAAPSGKGRRRGHLRRRPKDEVAEAVETAETAEASDVVEAPEARAETDAATPDSPADAAPEANTA